MINKIFKHLIGYLLCLISLLYRREKSLFLFGSDVIETNSNAFYLFRRMKELGYQCYWVYKEDNIDLKNFDAVDLVRFGTISHLYKILNSKVFFITHTIYDVSFCKFDGVKVINLWHGIPIKLLGYDSQVFIESNSLKFRMGLKPEFNKWDYFCCSSIFFKDKLSNAFKLENTKMLVTGSAKNYRIDRSKLDFVSSLMSFSSIILYAPTYRPWKSTYLNFVDDKKFIEYLELNNVCFLYKLHPYELNQLPSFKNCKNIKDANVLFPGYSIDELYRFSNVLVTDFSSALFDFYITKRPFIIYAPDFEYYESRIGGSYINLKKDFSNSFCSDVCSLITKLKLAVNPTIEFDNDLSNYIDLDVEFKSIDLLIDELNRLQVI